MIVNIKHGEDIANLAYDAIKEIFDTDVKNKRVLLKPNVGRAAKPKTAVCTNPEVVRGLIRFFKEQEAIITVGDGSIWGVNLHDAMLETGIKEVCDEENVECVNLDEYGYIDLEIPNPFVIEKMRFSKLMPEIDCIVSIPVAKTHMYTGATLGIKNLKGCLYKMEKTKLHRLDKEVPDKNIGRVLDYGIADMAKTMYPHYNVIDASYAMEGLGPSVGTPLKLDLIIASKSTIAADFVCAELMGLKDKVPHLDILAGYIGFSKEDITVIPADYKKYQREFKVSSSQELEKAYPNIKLIEQGTCSACTATMMAFLTRHGYRFEQEKFSLATGKDLKEEHFNNPEFAKTFFIGNCAASCAKAMGQDYCKGCPPVSSSVLAFVENLEIDSE